MIGIVGNNDALRRLFLSLSEDNRRKVSFIAYQKVHPDMEFLSNEFPHLEVLQITNDLDLASKLSQSEVSLVFNVFANYMYKESLNHAKVLNIHPAPLPGYRGRHPLQWALINREKEFGITIHEMTPKVDDGRIGLQKFVSVHPDMSVRELRDKLLLEVEKDFNSFLNSVLEGTVDWKVNDPAGATYVTKRYPKESHITDWSNPDEIRALIMAMREEAFPAYIELVGNKLELIKAEFVPKKFIGYISGTVVGTRTGAATVVCGDGRCLRVFFKEEATKLDINTKL